MADIYSTNVYFLPYSCHQENAPCPEKAAALWTVGRLWGRRGRGRQQRRQQPWEDERRHSSHRPRALPSMSMMRLTLSPSQTSTWTASRTSRRRTLTPIMSQYVSATGRAASPAPRLSLYDRLFPLGSRRRRLQQRRPAGFNCVEFYLQRRDDSAQRVRRPLGV